MLLARHPAPQAVSLLLLALKQVHEAVAQFEAHLRLFRLGGVLPGHLLPRDPRADGALKAAGAATIVSVAVLHSPPFSSHVIHAPSMLRG